MQTNDELQDRTIRHAVHIERYKSGLVKRILRELLAAQKDLDAQLKVRMDDLSQKEKERFLAGKSAKTRRLVALRDTLKLYESQYQEYLRNPLTDELTEFGEFESQNEVKTLTKAVPIVHDFKGLSASQLAGVVTSTPFQGRLLKDSAKEWGRNRRKRVEAALRLGIIEGETTAQIVKRVRRELEISRASAETMVRTATNHVANQTKRQIVAANDDVIIGVKWVATLDTRTSEICRVRDNKVYKPENAKYPPAHLNCRSTVTYITRAAKAQDALKPNRTRSSMDGAVPQDLNYNQWLNQQPASVKLEVLGPTRYKMHKDGVAMDKFYSIRGERLWTLDELRKRAA